jgi:hypothetical protein
MKELNQVPLSHGNGILTGAETVLCSIASTIADDVCALIEASRIVSSFSSSVLMNSCGTALCLDVAVPEPPSEGDLQLRVADGSDLACFGYSE